MVSIAYNLLQACVSRQLLIHNHKTKLTKFEFRVLLKHYCKQEHKAAASVRRICEVEGEDVVSERVAQRFFRRINTGEENTSDLPRSGRSKLWYIENIRRVLEENPQKRTFS